MWALKVGFKVDRVFMDVILFIPLAFARPRVIYFFYKFPLAFTCRFAEKTGKFRGNGQPKTWNFPGIFGILGRRVSPKIPGFFGVLVIVAFRNFPEISTKRRNDERRGEIMNEEEK